MCEMKSANFRHGAASFNQFDTDTQPLFTPKRWRGHSLDRELEYDSPQVFCTRSAEIDGKSVT